MKQAEGMARPLAEVDPDIFQAIQHEVERQHGQLELIASENFTSEAILEATGSVFTNKYAEGYPGKRYYGGCEFTDVVENLFPSQDPLGLEVRLDGQLYRVIGVGEKQGKTLGQSLDNYIAIPISAYLKQYGSHNSIRVSGKAHGVGAQLNAAIDEVQVVLRARRHDAPGQPDSFVAETNENFLSLWKDLTQTLFITITAIAAIALVVGGIVIMNIMLVSVTERTREIGIRKAMGARRQDVLMQFLIESATVALLGGCLGVMFGISFAKSITAIIGMPSSVQLWAVVTALLVSTSVGLFFGVYPAKRAAKLDPIAALRFEL